MGDTAKWTSFVTAMVPVCQGVEELEINIDPDLQPLPTYIEMFIVVFLYGGHLQTPFFDGDGAD